MADRFLFVGGPRDGDWVELSNPQPIVQTPVEEPDAGRVGGTVLRMFQYKAHLLKVGKEVLAIYAPVQDNFPTTMFRLLHGYNAKQAQASRFLHDAGVTTAGTDNVGKPR